MIWKKIEDKIREKGWSVYKLTNEAGLTENYLYNLKSGLSDNPSFKVMVQIADALDVSLDQFREEN